MRLHAGQTHRQRHEAKNSTPRSENTTCWSRVVRGSKVSPCAKAPPRSRGRKSGVEIVIECSLYRSAELVFGWSFYRQGNSGDTSSADVFIDAALACSGAQGASPQSSILHCTMETLGSVARAAGGAATANSPMKLGFFRLGFRCLRSIRISGCFCRASNHVSVLSCRGQSARGNWQHPERDSASPFR